MANSFTITISAVDKATATVRKVNDAIGRMTRPFEEVGKSFKSLGRELGFEKIGKNLGNIGMQAGSAARSIGSIVAPMAAITGLGSVAGVAALADSWAHLGRSIDNSSRGIGVSAGQLQGFQGAAKLLGIDASTTTSSLDGLATTMQDAQWGRNQGAMVMFSQLGIGLKKTKDGAKDVIGEFKAIADAISKKTDPQVQALIANTLGLGAMLPFLREGSAGIERYEGMVKSLGYVMGDDAVKRGKEFSMSLAGLGIAVDGVKNSIGDALIPAMKPLIDQFSVWLATNRELIATDVGEWAKGFATWINSINWTKVGEGIVKFGEGIGKVVDWMGGWQNAALLVAGVMNAGLIVSVASLGGSLLTAGIGIVAFTGLLSGWKVAALEAGAATDAAAVSGGGLLGAIGAGISTIAAGLLSLLYSPSLNTGEDKEIARIRQAQGLPPAVPQTADQASHETAVSGAWKKLQGTDKDQSTFAMDYFKSVGWTPQQAAGIVGNGIAESNLDPKATGDWKVTGPEARGIFQLHADRQKDFKDWAGFKITDDRADSLKQYEFANYELTKGKEAKAGRALRRTADAESAGEVGSRKWLRPGLLEEDKAREAISRGALANQLDLPPLSAAPAGPYTKPADAGEQGSGGSNGTVKVEIEHKNMPEGTKVNVKTEGNVQASSRIAYSGVGSIA
ncbi:MULTISPECIES: phage tail tip lysozyme [unclassified Pseudomonas]|uniref:phage tail tip lysozyme n=2 Tax=Pseudomonas TaxID=286 RepID=UPI002B22D5E3|nr:MULTISPECIES: phage tail tip lysozyme [unclassified Pseudomonas]MEA9997049.1 phage tail tip lysozyme [Pseudomonas sp. AA4]MEB0089239.1 phage tail tip lysozyme [Pseudomonas sp. RTI1]MEB0128431.1 phage tail tip lysozyme [Pseudomonas sp. CCC1.2]MEB0155329.1 phage tail tip lysozyme [Pseudomonas sp. CCC4.3]MEB0221697.1 phage tail tip lysozyme [Pseudomonas sp. AB12(2023)]